MISKSVCHWLIQRITAVIMLPLPLFLPTVFSMCIYPMERIRELILIHPIKFILIAFLLCIAFYHSMLGIIVILEDYVSSTKLRAIIIIIMRIIFMITLLLFIGAIVGCFLMT
ncbi:succinate dehydrogenase, hydrophobic membrane anchor protein [Neoehrlichia mikurensis]|uniref:Succinate dehydrogenase hydrophobic membrane anchor subunit n=1 Tax=Neoehrlichia mikurensis TaxID=89586 RepID=A0A9Q9BQY2_9RICK|nr:succinate dehydrogenase, hydrophobic membrane anchor protein [Neoehrlichia mikurensis]QXK92146.1 succinate dehydrogenase, hydrophobic membrane anchor protein [Neoehrlichia mikurensis]QXK92603.1 succinate dehydrogenase, hydrophobic membrane anchor protein [Neoehrlichia mikurensis]QXK93840.1 succinate dehydrogenase, hydrophobic membrane anchor protein [Neoehrlichia mikurensis]UTO55165.1 succinate dehydrogenase, hydrophobic membrane anchor protein [Neoehrlichia mikurensis]UTO56085.1 succinate 